MDIFNLSTDEFEKKIDEIVENISEDELFNELIKNGLIIDKDKNQGY